MENLRAHVRCYAHTCSIEQQNTVKHILEDFQRQVRRAANVYSTRFFPSKIHCIWVEQNAVLLFMTTGWTWRSSASHIRIYYRSARETFQKSVAAGPSNYFSTSLKRWGHRLAYVIRLLKRGGCHGRDLRHTRTYKNKPELVNQKDIQLHYLVLKGNNTFNYMLELWYSTEDEHMIHRKWHLTSKTANFVHHLGSAVSR